MNEIKRKKELDIIIPLLKSNKNKEKVLEVWFRPKIGTQMEIGMPFYDIPEIVKRWENNWDKFKTFWKNNTQLRLSQVLINLDIMDNYPGVYYYYTDTATIISAGLLEERDIYLWGNNYDKSGNKLNSVKYILIKNIETEHIKKIIEEVENQKLYVSEKYLKLFVRELQRRKDES